MSGEDKDTRDIVKYLFTGFTGVYAFIVGASPIASGGVPFLRYFLYVFLLLFTIGEMILGQYLVLSYRQKLTGMLLTAVMLIVFSVPLMFFGIAAYVLVFDLVYALYFGLLILILVPAIYVGRDLTYKVAEPTPSPEIMMFPLQLWIIPLVISVIITIIFIFPLQPLLLYIATEQSAFLYFFIGMVIVFGISFAFLNRDYA